MDGADTPFFVEVDGASLWTVAFGPATASAIVFVGGWTGSSELWLGPIGNLSARHRCIAYDHRGTGVTIAEPASVTHQRLVDDLFEVMRAHGVERAVLAAESAGAGVVLAAATRHPDRVAGLVLVDPLLPTERPDDGDPFVRALRADYEATAAAFVEACVPDPALVAIRAWGRSILARSSAEHAVALLRADVPDPPIDPTAIKAPALLIHCSGDRISPLSGTKALAAELPTSTLHVLDGSEHVPTITRPGEVAGLIEGWLATLA